MISLSFQRILCLALPLSFSTVGATNKDGNDGLPTRFLTHEERFHHENQRRRAYIMPDQDKKRYFVQYNHVEHGKELMFQHLAQKTHDAIDLVYNFDSDDMVVMEMTREDMLAMENDDAIAMIEEDPPREPMYIDKNKHKEQWEQLMREYPDHDDLRRHLVESTPYGIDMVQAPQVWDAGYQGAGVKVCVVDSGIDETHEDFEPGLDGYLEQSASLLWSVDYSGHGTHCAGTVAAAIDNDLGVMGVAPKAEIYVVKVFNNRGVFASSLINAANRCAAAGANIISMSLGGSFSNRNERNKFQEMLDQGIIPIAAAGNDGNSGRSYPASYDAVVSVAAVDSQERKASFSQFNDQVNIAGPGVSVWSTLPSKSPCEICEGIRSYNYNGFPYGAISGTSMATPHVAGVAALLMSSDLVALAANPASFARKVQEAMESTAKDKGSAGKDVQFGYGIVQAYDALQSLLGDNGDNNSEPDECADGEANFRLTLRTDNYGGETLWQLQRNNQVILSKSSSTYVSNSEFVEDYCVPLDGCYNFTIGDTYGDGMCCSHGTGSWVLDFDDGAALSQGGQFTRAQSVTFGCAPQPTPTAPQPTPTAPQPTPTAPQPTPTAPQPTPTAPQPTPTAPQPTPTAPQPTPTAPQPTPTGSPPNADDGCDGPEVPMQLYMVTNWRSNTQNSFSLIDDLNNVYWNYPTLNRNWEYRLLSCVDPSRCYQFAIFDSAGNGMSCWPWSCGFIVDFNNGQQQFSDSDFGAERYIYLGNCD